MHNTRKIERIITGTRTTDSDGVHLTRVIGTPVLNMLDPFLLFDVFGSEEASDYIGGFPAHPHRGFETVTYMLAGKMRHKDSAENVGVIEEGGVQWMSAGKGVIHSEMPEQEEGLLAGFQLWVNLPAAHKMDKPQYQEYSQSEIPEERRGKSCRLKVIAGETSRGTRGIIKNDCVNPVFWDIHLEENAQFSDFVPESHHAFIYMIDGELIIGNSDKSLKPAQLAILSSAEQIAVVAQTDCRFLIISGQPINESVARGGPFVMNTQEEIKQAFSDYQSGQLV